MSYFFPPLPYFVGFTAFTPEVPKLYWNVKSQEQRILEICKHLDKLINYADALALRINQLDESVNEELDQLEQDIDAKLSNLEEQMNANDEQIQGNIDALRSYVDTRFAQLAIGTMAYDVTTGTYRPSIETMRRLYSALAYNNTGARAIVGNMKENMSVTQLASMTVYKAAYSDRDSITINDQMTN